MPPLNDLVSLEAEFRARGWDRPATGRVLVELAIHLAVSLGGAAYFFTTPSILGKAAGLVVATLGSFGVATNTHTASHRGTSTSRALDVALSYFGYAFLLGLSATYWHHKHVVVHHRAPNVYREDDDIDLLPVFAILEPHRRAARGLSKGWFEVQWLILPLAIGLNAVNMAVTGCRFVCSRLLDRRRRRWFHVVDLSVLVMHLAARVALVRVFPPGEVATFFLLHLVLLGYVLFAGFAPAHLPAEAALLDRRARGADEYLAAVAATSLNIRTGPLGRFLCSGVDYQIEHHLFPGYCHVYYAKMAPIVEAYLRARGLPYRRVGWAEGVWKALCVFIRPKRVVRLFERREEA
jgi:fatty acid desaturase